VIRKREGVRVRRRRAFRDQPEAVNPAAATPPPENSVTRAAERFFMTLGAS
jgi:hypothetical protein